MGWWHWVVHLIGADYGAPYGRWIWENFWAGFGSDIAEFGLLGALGAGLRHKNCEVHRCWRLGRHSTAAGNRVCRRHMPGGAPTHADVISAHREAKQGG